MGGERGGELLPWKALVLRFRGSQSGGPEGGSQAASWSPAARSRAGGSPSRLCPHVVCNQGRMAATHPQALAAPSWRRAALQPCLEDQARPRAFPSNRRRPESRPRTFPSNQPPKRGPGSRTVYGLQTSESPGRASLQEREKGLPQLFPEKVFSSLLREKGLRGGVGEGNRACRRRQSRRGFSLYESRREHAGTLSAAAQRPLPEPGEPREEAARRGAGGSAPRRAAEGSSLLNRRG